MKLRRYTSDDYVNGIPCIYYWRNTLETVFPFFLGCRGAFDGSRRLGFRFANGYATSRNIDGGDLTTVLYAAVVS